MSSVLFLATEWGASKGGINAFNRDLAIHCGEMCRGRYSIASVVLAASEEDVADANDHGVKLLSLRKQQEVSEFTDDDLPAVSNLVRNTDAHPRFIVGHDLFTGPLAIGLSAALRVRSVLFIHTAYASFKTVQDGFDPQRAHEKVELQTSLIRCADYVMGVGPALAKYARSLDGADNTKKIRSFVPGLPEVPMRCRPHNFRVITFGRFDERNQILKQHPLCVEAFCKFVAESLNNFSDEDREDLTDKSLLVIGLSSDQLELKRQHEAIKQCAERVGVAMVVDGLPFQSRERTWEHLRSSSLGLMLSWREGFGLVGWETIAAGVPLLMSRRSGLYYLLRNYFDHLDACFHSVEVRGTAAGGPNAQDIDEAKYEIRRICRDHERFWMRARTFLNLLRKHYTWRKRARVFLKRLDSKAFDFRYHATCRGSSPRRNRVENLIDSET